MKNLRPFASVRTFGLAAVVLVLAHVPSELQASGRAETLQAIRSVENPRNTMRPGRFGELGPYQFRAATWRMHTTVPFSRAVEEDAAQTVAIRHYEWIRRGLVRNGVDATPYNIALAWNNGLSAVVRGRTSASARNYAERVDNLVQDMKVSRLASTP